MKKILVISYYWPPSGGSGVQRWLYFCHYLKASGFEVDVLTIDPSSAAYPSIDNSLVELTKGINVHYASSTFNPVNIYAKFKKGNLKKQVPAGNFGSKKKTFFDQISGFIRANFFLPDARVTWNKNALAKAIEIHESNQFDLVITTGPPHSTHLIGLALKKKYGIKWLADFRDPWQELYYNSLFKKLPFAKKIDAKLENEVLIHADQITTVGPSLKELLQGKISNQTQKVNFIYNGFDEKIFENCSENRSQIFTIAHIGTWSTQQAYKEIVEALTVICDEGYQIRFLLVGKIAPFILQELKTIPHLLLEEKGIVSHQEAVNEMYNADILLNCYPILTQAEYMISGKLMEYLASGNYSITIGDLKSDGAQLLQQFPSAEMIANNDVEQLIQLIKNRYASNRERFVYPELLEKFTRKATSVELIEVLNNL
jgi:glycosyltransferase involved in cell wall biosynthesis